ncbi:MAG: hypothetical protein JWN49_501 [Parcubacteria group bacterium]|nr:hypothetical protein [Parcubacteria group bacterium]
MYEEHPSFRAVDDESVVWRFMEFAKFCSLLETSSLFFSRPENLIDPWEGHTPKGNFADENYKDVPDDVKAMLIEHAKLTLPGMVRKELAVNCWHINETESEAFWRNYSDRGIAIQSTFGKLKNSFVDPDYSIHIGAVEYKDHNVDTIDPTNIFHQILWKRRSFDYEQELRAVIWALEDAKGKGAKPFTNPKGQYIKIDISTLIENVYTTPFEKEDWFSDLIKDISKRYGFSFPISKSNLMQTPF